MLPSVHIPSAVSQDCLAWSSDGELAVAASEEVYILMPRYEYGKPWTLVHFRVNTFSFEEWPMQELASFADMSIGEEQSRVSVVSVAWSSAGLAKHGRSVLAVLTSNLLLSIWAPGPNATDPTTWERVFIFNDITVPSNGPSGPSPHSLRRVRSMAWAPAITQYSDSQVSSLEGKGVMPIIAIADSTNHVYFLRVFSPFSCHSSIWDVQVLTHKALLPVQRNSHRPSLLQAALNVQYFVDRIRFDSWNSKNEVCVTCQSFGVYYKFMLSLSFGTPLSATTSDQVDKVEHRGTHNSSITLPAPMEMVAKPQLLKYGSDRRLSPEAVSLRLWGTATFDDVLAACITLHPRGMLEYQVSAESSATILFCINDVEHARQPDRFSWQIGPAVDVEEVRKKILATIIDPPLSSINMPVPGTHAVRLNEFDRKMVDAAIHTLCPDQRAHSLQKLHDLGLNIGALESRSFGTCPFCEVEVTPDALVTPMEARCINGHVFGTFFFLISKFYG